MIPSVEIPAGKKGGAVKRGAAVKKPAPPRQPAALQRLISAQKPNLTQSFNAAKESVAGLGENVDNMLDAIDRKEKELNARKARFLETIAEAEAEITGIDKVLSKFPQMRIRAQTIIDARKALEEATMNFTKPVGKGMNFSSSSIWMWRFEI